MIPKLHYISQGITAREHLDNIQKACTSGAELVLLHLKSGPGSIVGRSERKFLKIAQEAREITAHFQTRLLLSDHYKIAKEVKADGVHLEKTDTSISIVRAHLYTWQFIGGTANTLEDCETLIDFEVDYITLGPFRTLEKNENLFPSLGLNGYAAIMDILKTETPIIGFGGITTKDVSAILETGISGLAVSDEITHDFNTVRIFNQLINASSTAEKRYTFE